MSRIPIAIDLKSRDGSLHRDSGTKNCVVEIAGDQSAVMKRPGKISMGTPESGLSKLLACYNGELKSVVGDTLSDLIIVTVPPVNSMPDALGDTWAGLAYGSGKFVTISKYTGIVATSPNGIDWETHPAIDTSTYDYGDWNSGPAYGNGIFVATYGSDNQTFTSLNGVDWTDQESPEGMGASRLKFTNGKFFMLASGFASGAPGNVLIKYSDDGVLWTGKYVETGYVAGTLVTITDVEFFSGEYHFMSIDATGTSVRVSRTSNFSLWNSRELSPSSKKYGLTVSGPHLVNVGGFYTSDGVNWTPATGIPSGYLMESHLSAASVDGKLYTVAYKGDSSDPMASYVSDDNGATWTELYDFGAGKYFRYINTDGTSVFSLSDSLYLIATINSAGTEVRADQSSSHPLTPIDSSLLLTAEVSGQAQSQNVMMFKTAKEAWVYDGKTLSKVSDPDYPGWSSVVPVSVTLSGSVATVSLPAPVNWKGKSIVTVSGADQTEYNGDHEITIVDSTTISYEVTGTPASPATGTITVVGGITTVPGVVYLDGYFFVMDDAGIIYNCDLTDVSTWNALDFIAANTEPGSGVALAKSQNYVVALKAWSTEFFYDAGNPTGSPLSPVLNGFSLIGCASGASVANVDGVTVFVSKTRQKGRSVHAMNGIEQKKISTPDVDRILNAFDMSGVSAFGIKTSGHTFYVLNIPEAAITLVYDAVSNVWGTWTSTSKTAPVSVTAVYSAGAVNVHWVSHGLSNGSIVEISGADQPEHNGMFCVNVSGPDDLSYVPTISAAITGTLFASHYFESRFDCSRYVFCSGRDIVMNDSGEMFEITESAYSDDGFPIISSSKTSKIDGNNNQLKSLGKVTVVGNQSEGRAYIGWTDDDGKSTSKVREVDLNVSNPVLRRCGIFRRRSFEVVHFDESPFQIASLEIE